MRYFLDIADVDADAFVPPALSVLAGMIEVSDFGLTVTRPFDPDALDFVDDAVFSGFSIRLASVDPAMTQLLDRLVAGTVIPDATLFAVDEDGFEAGKASSFEFHDVVFLGFDETAGQQTGLHFGFDAFRLTGALPGEERTVTDWDLVANEQAFPDPDGSFDAPGVFSPAPLSPQRESFELRNFLSIPDREGNPMIGSSVVAGFEGALELDGYRLDIRNLQQLNQPGLSVDEIEIAPLIVEGFFGQDNIFDLIERTAGGVAFPSMTLDVATDFAGSGLETFKTVEFTNDYLRELNNTELGFAQAAFDFSQMRFSVADIDPVTGEVTEAEYFIDLGRDDLIMGTSGDDFLFGGDGNDTLIGGSGRGFDTYDGGEGTDTLVYASTTNGVVVDLLADEDHASGPDIDVDQIFNIQNLILGGGFNSATGSEESNLIQGGDDGNILNGAGGNNTLLGGEGHDTLVGGTGDDLIEGGPGNDFLIGGGGNNTLDGGEGNDTIEPGEGNDTITTGPGDDLVIGGAAALGGDLITDLEPGDTVLVRGATLQGEPSLIFDGTDTTLRADLTGDGAQDFALSFSGDLTDVALRAEQADDSIRIFINQPSSIAGDTTGDVTEDDLEAQQAAGVLTVTDPDSGEDRFQPPEPEALAGDFGGFAFDPETGEWLYTLDNDAEAVQALPEGEQVTDTLTVTSLDGTASETITVTITGVNDPASIAGDTTGDVTEDDPEAQQAAGVLTVTDPDAGEDRFQPPEPEALAGDFGGFAFDPETGEWLYTLDNDAEAVQALPEGEQVTDTLTVTSLDGTASETITVTITGAGLRDTETPAPDPVPDDPGLAPTHALRGVVTTQGGDALEGVSMTFSPDDGADQATDTDSSGFFTFEFGAGMSGQIDATLPHDPESDGSLSASDALDVLRLSVGLEPSFGPAVPEAFIAADMDGDGQVTAGDALDVLRVAVGLETDHAPRWVFVDAEADLSHIDRGTVDFDTGVTVDGLTQDTEVSMTGILIGSMQEFA